MEPLSTTSIRRAFHWGLVVLVDRDWDGELPKLDPDRPVTGDATALLIPVLHAQESDTFEDNHLVFAQAELVVRRWASTPDPRGGLQEIYRGSLDLRSGNLTVGDADEWLTIPLSAGANIVTVSYDASAPLDVAPERVWVDVAPADSVREASTTG